MKVNEIFYSLQGEGYYTGTAAVFVRLSGCNLQCPFCDTNHENGNMMTEEEIVDAVSAYPARMVVVTGGEPSLQLTESLVDALHKKGKYVSVETNGTHQLPDNVDWITLSPKDSYMGEKAKVVLSRVDEVKTVFDGSHEPTWIEGAKHYFIQPCDTGNQERNKAIVEATIEYVKRNPEWRLSLQTHKILDIR